MQARFELGIQVRIQLTGAQRLGQVGGDHGQQLVGRVEALAEPRAIGLGYPRQSRQRHVAAAQAGSQRMREADAQPAHAVTQRRIVDQQRLAQAGQAA